jgi:hypothetical protein
MTLLSADPGTLRVQVLVHALGGLLVLLTATVLSVSNRGAGYETGVRQEEKQT